jgi:C-terminal processing protease CtpA/Prc
MKNNIISILTTLLFFNNAISQTLTQEEKVADFNYLYVELEKSYPYFEVNKRMNNIDWLSKKEQYTQKIIESETDKAFFIAITSILNELNNDHTDTYPTVIYKYFYDGYKRASIQDSTYLPYVKELEKTDTIRTKYWAEINNAIYKERNASKSKDASHQELDKQVNDNIVVDFNDSLSVAVIRIQSFSYDYIERDSQILKQFFKKAHTYKNLVIDIQGNNGGATEYWMDYMIPYLINEPITFSMTYGFKKSDRLKAFKPTYFEGNIEYRDINLPKMPEELKNGDYMFRKSEQLINPNQSSKKYTGKIYLLVDNVVFSSAETLAYFCKMTKFATVVGEKTNGDGVGTDPLLLTLPKSGIVIRFTGEMGLNPDGSANDETKTIPDILLKETDKKGSVLALLNIIREGENNGLK